MTALAAFRAAMTRHRGGSAPNGGFTIIAGLDINVAESAAEGAEGKTDDKRAKATKITLVRSIGETKTSEGGAHAPGYTLTEVLKNAHEEGLKVSYITWQGIKGITGVTTAANEKLEKYFLQTGTLAAQIEAAITALGKAVVEETLTLIEFGNEVWPATGSGFSEGLAPTGKAYIEAYVSQAKLLKEAGLTWVHYGMQVNTSKETGAETWMKEIVEYCEAHTAAVKEAFVGGGTEAKPNGRLVSHVYGGKMTSKLESLTSPYGFKDTGGSEYGAQRWTNQQALIFKATTLTVPLCISEVGYNLNGKTEAEKNERITALWLGVKEYQEGTNSVDWPTFAAGYKPQLAIVIYYAQYEKTGEETYGLMPEKSEVLNASGTKFKEGVEAL